MGILQRLVEVLAPESKENPNSTAMQAARGVEQAAIAVIGVNAASSAAMIAAHAAVNLGNNTITDIASVDRGRITGTNAYHPAQTPASAIPQGQAQAPRSR